MAKPDVSEVVWTLNSVRGALEALLVDARAELDRNSRREMIGEDCSDSILARVSGLAKALTEVGGISPDHAHQWGEGSLGECLCGALPCNSAGCDNEGTVRDFMSPTVDYYCADHVNDVEYVGSYV